MPPSSSAPPFVFFFAFFLSGSFLACPPSAFRTVRSLVQSPQLQKSPCCSPRHCSPRIVHFKVSFIPLLSSPGSPHETRDPLLTVRRPLPRLLFNNQSTFFGLNFSLTSCEFPSVRTQPPPDPRTTDQPSHVDFAPAGKRPFRIVWCVFYLFCFFLFFDARPP